MEPKPLEILEDGRKTLILPLYPNANVGKIKESLSNFFEQQGRQINHYHLHHPGRPILDLTSNQHNHLEINEITDWSMIHKSHLDISSKALSREITEDMFTYLQPNIIRKMALDLPYSEIINLCQLNKRFNQVICTNKLFWNNKILLDFGVNMLQGGRVPSSREYLSFEEVNKRDDDWKVYNIIKYGYYMIGLNLYLTFNEDITNEGLKHVPNAKIIRAN